MINNLAPPDMGSLPDSPGMGSTAIGSSPGPGNDGSATDSSTGSDNDRATIGSSNESKSPMTIPNENKSDYSADPSNPFQFERLSNTRSAEMPYQSRYFTVYFDADGNITNTDMMHIAAITATEAQEYAVKVYSSDKTSGMFHSYRYKKASKEDGSSFVVFVDMSSSIYNAYTLLLSSLLVGAFALIAMFILVYIFSTQAVAPVVESLEKQKRFITDAGHELKTPLAVISANVDVLELEAGKNEWTSSIRNQLKRMNSLVKNLLTLSRMDEERMHVVFSDFDLSKTVLETGTSFQAMAESKNKRYQIDVEDGIHITGDKNSINQLVSLLLDNAMKYSSDNGYIHLLLQKDKIITLEVSNTCDYIPDGNLDRLFDRFYRADTSRSRDTGGYGIGLSVARAIAQSHGGDITALRDGDKIIRFVVKLPKTFPKGKIQAQTAPASK